jgi:hypothetical protein
MTSRSLESVKEKSSQPEPLNIRKLARASASVWTRASATALQAESEDAQTSAGNLGAMLRDATFSAALVGGGSRQLLCGEGPRGSGAGPGRCPRTSYCCRIFAGIIPRRKSAVGEGFRDLVLWQDFFFALSRRYLQIRFALITDPKRISVRCQKQTLVVYSMHCRH